MNTVTKRVQALIVISLFVFFFFTIITAVSAEIADEKPAESSNDKTNSPKPIAWTKKQKFMLDSFGEPKSVINEPDGGQTWIYPNMMVEAKTPNGSKQEPKIGKWVLRFDEYGMLTESNIVFDDGSWMSTIPIPDLKNGSEK
jgi:hypothetical protein